MTTIAASLDPVPTIAADSKFTFEDGTVGFQCEKLYRIGHSIFGTSGDDEAFLLIEWLRRGGEWNDRPEIRRDADILVIELAPDGLFLWDELCVRVAMRERNYAIGSGHPVALYCMRVLGMSPTQAVREAAKIDPYTDDTIETMTLDVVQRAVT